MRMIVSTLALLSLVPVAGCGSPALTCQPETCPTNSAMTYQLCVNVDATESYNFGGQSCHCSAANCQSCTQMIAAYCGGGTGSGACSVTLSGAVTGTFGCSAATVYANSTNIGGPSLTVTSPSPLQGLNISIARPGEPMSGTWTNSDAGSQAGLVVTQPGTPGPTWDCTVGGSSSQGTYSMNLNVGAATVSGNGKSYTASGTITATLPAVNGTGATGTVNLTATF